ncbi:hypothetical protein ACVWW4_006602 [Bradyrhizobium sp. LB7.1]
MKSMVLAGALALCLSLTWAAVAEAQFEALAFTVCKKIPTDADRLKCYDAIGPKAKTTEEEVKDPTPEASGSTPKASPRLTILRRSLPCCWASLGRSF